ncbi:MAG: hypothetical protein QXI75_01785, partial [Candidatus Anstonellales archaeon]
MVKAIRELQHQGFQRNTSPDIVNTDHDQNVRPKSRFSEWFRGNYEELKGRFNRFVYSLGIAAYLFSGGLGFAQQNSQVQPIPQANTTLKWEDFVKRIPLDSQYHFQMITLHIIDQDKKNTDRYKNGLVYISDHSPLLYRPLMEVNAKAPTPWEIHFLFAPILLNRTLPIPGINKPYLEYIRELYLEEIKATTQKYNRDLLSLY